MIRQLEIGILPAHLHNEAEIKKQISQHLNLPSQRIKGFHILKRSIDARSREVVYKLKLDVFIDEVPASPEIISVNYGSVADKKQVVIVGAGPAGLFAALRLIELGIKPVVIERGKDVKERRRDLAAINKDGIVNPESNYCFGEGGAGTYSDGKLYTRSTKRGDVEGILRTFVAHGAEPDILIDARPHIGTNKLPQIITRMRESILNAGGEIHFNTKLTDIVVQFGKVTGVKMQSAEMLMANAVILATGHSARDVFYLLRQKNILIEPKPFALGVRIEHPQHIIDNIQYHCAVRDENLPPAYYSLVEQVDERGVFSFCMCPGGIIAPCATDSGEVVVNGWSPSKRNNPFANSGIVVQLNPEDIPRQQKYGPLAALEYQKLVEQKAFVAAGSNLAAPAQRMVDFVNRKTSVDLPVTSYLPGVASVDLDEVLPPFISERLQKALPLFGKKMPPRKERQGYYTNEAVLVGVESRTSSPVRIPREQDTLQHPEVKGLFPCGEGAGYAGGIISAAIDGMRCAEAAAKLLE